MEPHRNAERIGGRKENGKTVNKRHRANIRGCRRVLCVPRIGGLSGYAWESISHQKRGATRRRARRLYPHGGERSEEHTSELQSHHDLVCRLLLEKKKKKNT